MRDRFRRDEPKILLNNLDEGALSVPALSSTLEALPRRIHAMAIILTPVNPLLPGHEGRYVYPAM
jgi:hypothetical protein